MYFDDFNVGDVFDLPTITIDKDKMFEFAKEYDPQKIHLDEEYGKASRYGTVIAPGIMSFMSVWAEFVRSDIITEHFIAAQSFRINWIAPVFAGDKLTGKVIVKKVTPRNAYNGIIDINLSIYDEQNKLVMDTLTEAILKRNYSEA